MTFLFTDIEGSTLLWEQHATPMQTALARHDEILREAIESSEGEVLKHTGDGTLAVFGAAEGAVAAAIGVQRALATEQWGETGPLPVRIGLHTGSAEQRGGDYFGPTLNRAAQLTGVAHGGQILCSRATARSQTSSPFGADPSSSPPASAPLRACATRPAG